MSTRLHVGERLLDGGVVRGVRQHHPVALLVELGADAVAQAAGASGDQCDAIGRHGSLLPEFRRRPSTRERVAVQSASLAPCRSRPVARGPSSRAGESAPGSTHRVERDAHSPSSRSSTSAGIRENRGHVAAIDRRLAARAAGRVRWGAGHRSSGHRTSTDAFARSRAPHASRSTLGQATEAPGIAERSAGPRLEDRTGRDRGAHENGHLQPDRADRRRGRSQRRCVPPHPRPRGPPPDRGLVPQGRPGHRRPRAAGRGGRRHRVAGRYRAGAPARGPPPPARHDAGPPHLARRRVAGPGGDGARRRLPVPGEALGRRRAPGRRPRRGRPCSTASGRTRACSTACSGEIHQAIATANPELHVVRDATGSILLDDTEERAAVALAVG